MFATVVLCGSVFSMPRARTIMIRQNILL